MLQGLVLSCLLISAVSSGAALNETPVKKEPSNQEIWAKFKVDYSADYHEMFAGLEHPERSQLLFNIIDCMKNRKFRIVMGKALRSRPAIDMDAISMPWSCLDSMSGKRTSFVAI